jgi:hypothetical protein
MQDLEQILVLFVAAVILAAAARRVGAPYPVFLALGGALLAFLPGVPSFTVAPELVLALFVAPVLLDAAYDASLRDLRDNWAPVTGLVIFAVGFTTAAVAFVVHTLIPTMPWAAAVALGAVVAPPDAVAATAVLRPLRPPHRLLTILEGESLLNDATALLIFRLAVGAVALNSFSISAVAPTFLFVVAGSVLAGPALGWLILRVTERVQHVPTAIILQFISTFGVWMLAERVGLSGVLTTVSCAMAVARTAPERISTRIRIPTNAVWQTVIFALNILAFHFHRPADPADPGKPGSSGPRTILRRRRGGSADCHRCSLRLAHVVQCGHEVVATPARFSSSSADAPANHRQRLDHFLGGHARHRHSCCGDGAATGVSVSRSDRAHSILGRAGYARDPGTDAQAAHAFARFA